MTWKLNPCLQQKFDAVVAQTAQLQAELGIKPRTLAQRAEDYHRRQADQAAPKRPRRPLPQL